MLAPVKARTEDNMLTIRLCTIFSTTNERMCTKLRQKLLCQH